MRRLLLATSLLFTIALSAQTAQTLPGADNNDSTPSDCPKSPMPSDIARKPVIYLYPQRDTYVNIRISGAQLLNTYPAYDNKTGWRVLAHPGGLLTNLSDEKQYSYLFWDGVPLQKMDWDRTTGWRVEGTPDQTAAFLQEKLSGMGLEPREYNEFIVYWLPKLTARLPSGYPRWNIIHFATPSEYADKIPLQISPKPDSLLRLYMFWEPIVAPNGGSINLNPITPQPLAHFQRIGFTVVEWGGQEG